MPDLVLDYHRLRTPIDHPDLSITRNKLEYPTVDVSFVYLASINKLDYFASAWAQDYWIVTNDVFADKAVEGIISGHSGFPSTRHSIISASKADGNFYWIEITVPYTTQDFILFKRYGNNSVTLGYEAIDLATGETDYGKISSSGSTHKAYRDNPTTPKVTATDTSIASGYAGFGYCAYYASSNNAVDSWFAKLVAPSSPSMTSIVVIEMDIDGSGKHEDPFRPVMQKNIVDILSLPNLPSFLHMEAKKYNIMKKKGFTDDEIELLLGAIPKRHVDLDSVTWGAFEFHPDKSSTVVITITGDNPYKRGAIERQVRSTTASRVFKAPRSYRDAVELYNMLKSDHQYWLAGKDNFAHQVLGLEELDTLQNVDFYYGELLEHKTHYNQLKQVPEWEIINRLNELREKLSKISILIDERNKHLRKIDEIIRKGW